MDSLHLLVSYITCLHLTIAFSSPCSSLSSSQKRKMYNDLGFDNHPVISLWELGLPRSEGHMTDRFSLWTHYLRNHTGGGLVGFGFHVILVRLQEHWVLSCLTAPNLSFRPSLEEWDLPQVELCSTKLYRSTTLHPQGGWGKWSSTAHLSTAAIHSGTLWGYYDCTCIFTKHHCLLKHAWWWSVGEGTKCSVFPLCYPARSGLFVPLL